MTRCKSGIPSQRRKGVENSGQPFVGIISSDGKNIALWKV
jgi:hypothetical protein